MRTKSKKAVGTCYASAFEILMDCPEDAVLVHGYPRLTSKDNHGKKFGHAWIEREINGVVLVCDYQHDKPILGALYYAVGQIDPAECKRYTRLEAMRKVLKTERYGPWGRQPKDALFG